MFLRQTFTKPISGNWDFGPKTKFDWFIDTLHGQYVESNNQACVGSWEANYRFVVSRGKTDKQTLANARRKLSSNAKKHGLSCTFEYVVEDKRKSE